MDFADRKEVKQVFRYPLLEAIARRRTRRFPLGGAMPSGALEYKSKNAPVPLNDIETAILCWAGNGITGTITGDLPTDMMVGGGTFGTWAGRAVPHGCNIYSSKLFFTNDDGLFLYDPKEASKPVEIDTEADRNKIMEYFRENTRRLSDKRLEVIPRGIARSIHWNTNQSGTTIFIPIIDQTQLFLNYLIGVFQQDGYQLFDDIKGRFAGIDKWINNGALKGPRVPLSSAEYFSFIGNIAPAYLIAHNIHLTAEAIGLGSLIFSGYTSIIMMGGTSLGKGLGFRFVKTKDGKPNPVGLDGVVEPYCPPYYKSMDEAVDAFVEMKFGTRGTYGCDYPGATPFQGKWQQFSSCYQKATKETIQIVKDCCNYIYETYGRFPGTIDTVVMPVWLQVHHLEMDFYDKFVAPNLVNETHRQHVELWHK